MTDGQRDLAGVSRSQQMLAQTKGGKKVTKGLISVCCIDDEFAFSGRYFTPFQFAPLSPSLPVQLAFSCNAQVSQALPSHLLPVV